MSFFTRSLGLRILTSLVVLPIGLTLLWVPALKWGYVAFIVFLMAVGLFEYYRLAKKMGLEVEETAGILGGVAITLAAAAFNLVLLNAVLMASILLVAASHVVRQRLSLQGIAATVFGLVYVGWASSHIILTYGLDRGPGTVMLLVITIVWSDTGAYFVGKAVGKRKLAPVVSPNKTWEGSVGGFVIAVAVMVLTDLLRRYYDWTALPDWSVYRYAAVAAAMSVAGQIGDLLESSMKRDAGVKDSGTIFPGHGGMLDRFDGFLFASPVLYYIAAL